MASPGEPVPRIVAEGILKAFSGSRALAGAELEVAPGEVHALLGENGAGKSTLFNVLTGVLSPDAGKLVLDGEPYAPEHPEQAAFRGVQMVPQDAALCLHLTVAENLVLGRWPSLAGFVGRRRQRELAAEAMAEVLGRELVETMDLDAPASSLAASERQLVAIARAFATADLKLLILDEPTASLSAREVKLLFAAILRIKARGVSVLYASHILEEVLEIADRYTVLRDGLTVATGVIKNTTSAQLVEMMAGRPTVASTPRQRREPGTPVLEVASLTGRELPEDVSLKLHSGEILGISGLLGSGRTELLRCVFGLDPIKAGSIVLRGERGYASPARRWRQGVGLLSEDRKLEGLSQRLSIEENLALACGARFSRAGFIDRRAEGRAVEGIIQRLGIVCRGRHQPICELSGGNQQKVALGRLLMSQAVVWLLDEPTRGVDVRSRSHIHSLIADAARAGTAVLMVSSYLPELLSLSDRIAVMRRGKLGPARLSQQLTEHALLSEAMGA